MAACVDLESTDGGSHRRNRRCARLELGVIDSSLDWAGTGTVAVAVGRQDWGGGGHRRRH